MLIKPATRKTFNDMVKTIRARVNPTRQGVEVTAFRKTKSGALILKIRNDTVESAGFKKSIEEAVGTDGSIRNLTSRVQLDILDLDCVATIQDVEEALRKETGRDGDFGVHIFGPNKAEQYMAVCDLEVQEAKTLKCHIRRRLTVKRCFKCLGYGHTKATCKGPDRSECCRKCGAKEHVGRDCKAEPKCFLYSEKSERKVDHLPGVDECANFRAALEECRKRAR